MNGERKSALDRPHDRRQGTSRAGWLMPDRKIETESFRFLFADFECNVAFVMDLPWGSVSKPVEEMVHNSLNFNDKVQLLNKKLRDLNNRKWDLDSELEGQLRSGKKQKKEVEQWWKDVQDINVKVQSIQQEIDQQHILRSMITLGKSVAKAIEKVVELYEKSNTFGSLVIEESPSRKESLLTGMTIGEAAAGNLETIGKYLRDDSVKIIGIGGMEGIGKTTLVTKIYNEMLRNDKVFITVSRKPSIHALQCKIAKEIHLNLSDEDKKLHRAARLSAELKWKDYGIVLDDCKIPRDELIEYFIVEGLVGGRSWKAQLNGGKRFMVEAGMTLQDWDCECWEDVKKTSLMNNAIEEDSSSVPMRCQHISTLLLQRNWQLTKVSDSLLANLRGLCVLDLSYTRLERVSDPISNLENLTALLFRHCGKLCEVPSLEKLIGYKILPEGLFTKLSRLQVLSLLKFGKGFVVKGKEVGSLPKLEVLNCKFYDEHEYNNFICQSDGGRYLSKYQFEVGLTNFLYEGEYSKKVVVRPPCLEHDSKVLLPRDIECLRLFDLDVIENICDACWLMSEEDQNGCIPLRSLKALHLISLGSLYQTLYLRDLVKLKSLFLGFLHCHIHVITILGCPKLKRLPLQLHMQQLLANDASQSSSSTSSPPFFKHVFRANKNWWDSVEWNDLSSKSLLEPFVDLHG
ncbi:NB-ARC [Dillenia turbinata]|uniref:NB-ARC n=1 Tax=Dillenia turbinata TaxID=194707 RepID=A0AAN8WHT8_9MAGN